MEIHPVLRKLGPDMENLDGVFLRKLYNDITEEYLTNGGVRSREDAKSKVKVKASHSQEEVIRKQKI